MFALLRTRLLTQAAASALLVTAALAAPAAARPGAAPAPAAASAPAPTAAPCAELSRYLPNLREPLCEAADLRPSGARSVKGFPLLQRDVLSPPPEGERRRPNNRRVLVIGGIHGDELSSTSLVFHWIAHATQTPAGMDWRFVPAVNPDGLLLAKPTRTNANKVDLNRNFPTPHWEREAPKYWQQRTKNDPRRYPGAKPLSEPESQFIVDTMARWKPDLIVSIHAPYGVLDYDGPNVPPQRLGRLYLDQVGIFPGSLGNFGGVHKGVPVVTIELPSAIRTPTEAEMRQMWVDLLRWITERVAAEPAHR
jgi:hypothetical protein